MLDVLRHRLIGFPSKEGSQASFCAVQARFLQRPAPALHPHPGCVTHPSSRCQVTHISCRRLLAGAMPLPESAPKVSSALPRVWLRLGSLGVSVVIAFCAPAVDQVFVHDCPSHRHTGVKQRSSAAQRAPPPGPDGAKDEQSRDDSSQARP